MMTFGTLIWQVDGMRRCRDCDEAIVKVLPYEGTWEHFSPEFDKDHQARGTNFNAADMEYAIKQLTALAA